VIDLGANGGCAIGGPPDTDPPWWAGLL